LLLGVHVTDETLKNVMKKHGVGLKGAGQLSFKQTYKSPDKVVIDVTPETAPKFITYMSKGKYEPKYYTGYDKETIDLCKSEWITYKRKSIDECLYDTFVQRVEENKTAFCLEPTTELLRTWAMNHALVKYGVLNLGCKRDARMLIDTYRYNHLKTQSKDIKLPFD